MNDIRYRVITAGARLPKRQGPLKLLRASGYEVQESGTEADLREALVQGEAPAIAFVDLKDPDFSGYEAMRILKESSPETQLIVLSQNHSTKEALEAQNRGAFCYFSEPIDAEEFLFIVAKASIVFELAMRNRDLQSAISGTPALEIIGKSEEARKILTQVKRVAPVDTTILLTGETGTGKTTLARFIHSQSHRASQPFISISCAAIPRELLEAELFGYEKGAFTGAQMKKIGSIELADKGTLFLDEIGDLPLELQPKLLTFLQDRQLRRLGGTKSTSMDVRIIVATNKDLETAVRAKNFREDLYFRVNVVSIRLPRLCDRKNDIPTLAENFLRGLAVRRGEKPYKISKEAVKQMQDYFWPGNIRELENVLERASLFCTDAIIGADDLSLTNGGSAIPPTTPELESNMTLAEVERKLIRQRLETFNGNKQQAAQSLGISLKTIYNKMRAYDLN